MEEWKADGGSHKSLILHISVYLESSRGGYAAKGVFDGEGITKRPPGYKYLVVFTNRKNMN